MANQITDGRTSLDTMESGSAPDDLTGATGGTYDNEIFYQGLGSWGWSTQNNRDGLLYDAGSVQSGWASNVFYLLVNCGVVGLLDIKANGGCTVRFCGNTVTDFFEVYVGGSDSWPTTFSGGWAQFVVDIEDAHTNSDNTGGTKPATNAIRYVGVSTITAGSMPRMVDNTWLDEVARLPDGSPGIIIEGRNGGSTDWTWDDVVAAATSTNKWGTARLSDGGAVVLNTPVQFGINDTSTHAFTDTNRIILWDDQEFLPDDVYGFSALGNSGGTTNVTLGVKTGTGTDATGAQGCTIAAAPLGARWTMDFDDPDLDGINLYGCQFIHGAGFQLDDAAVSVISSSYIDCSSALVTGSEQLKIKVIDANTADGVAFMTTDDLGDIQYSSFEFSDGHAVEFTTPRTASQTNTNTYTGYGATGTNDAAIYNNTAGAVTVTDSVAAAPTYRNGTSATTSVVTSVDFTLTNVISGSQFTLSYVRTTAVPAGTYNGTGDTIVQFTVAPPAGTPTSGEVRLFNGSYYDIYTYTGISGSQLTGISPALTQDYDTIKALIEYTSPTSITVDPYTIGVDPSTDFEVMLANYGGGTNYEPVQFNDNSSTGFSRRITQIEE